MYDAGPISSRDWIYVPCWWGRHSKYTYKVWVCCLTPVIPPPLPICCIPQKTGGVDPMLGWFWPIVYNASPTPTQHWINALCLLFILVALVRSAHWIHMTTHLPFSFSLRFCARDFLPSSWRLIVLRFSSCRSSWNSSFTLWDVLAEVSMKAQFHCLARAWPLVSVTSRPELSSHLLPTSITGMVSTSPLMSRISAKMGLSSSSDCLLVMEYTKIKAWPLEMESRCMAGNWWLPVVSVICSVHTCLLQLITWRYVSSMVGM